MKSPRFRAGGFLCPFVRGGFVRVPAVRPIHWGLLYAFARRAPGCSPPPRVQLAGSAAAAYGKFLRYGKNSS